MKDAITIEIELPPDTTLFQLVEAFKQVGLSLKVSAEKQPELKEPSLRLTGVAA